MNAVAFTLSEQFGLEMLVAALLGGGVIAVFTARRSNRSLRHPFSWSRLLTASAAVLALGAAIAGVIATSEGAGTNGLMIWVIAVVAGVVAVGTAMASRARRVVH